MVFPGRIRPPPPCIFLADTFVGSYVYESQFSSLNYEIKLINYIALQVMLYWLPSLSLISVEILNQDELSTMSLLIIWYNELFKNSWLVEVAISFNFVFLLIYFVRYE